MKFTTFDELIKNQTNDKIEYIGNKLENISIKNYTTIRKQDEHYKGKIYIDKYDLNLVKENFEKDLNNAGWNLCYEDCPIPGYESCYDIFRFMWSTISYKR